LSSSRFRAFAPLRDPILLFSREGAKKEKVK